MGAALGGFALAGCGGGETSTGSGGTTASTTTAVSSSSGPSTTSSSSGGTGGAAPFQLELSWYACPLVQGQNAECAKTEVPLDWSNPSGKKISYFLKRVPAKQQPARGQVWLLQGGPGASGSTIEGLSPSFQAVAPDLDVYIPDHRGTGLSERLACDSLDALATSSTPLDPTKTPALVQPCVDQLGTQWAGGLAFFSATDAARDVGELIAFTKKPSEQVYLFGVSYGTRWAHRYLQQYPTQANGVVFDSILGETPDWFQFDQHIDAAAHAIFDACKTDAYCSGKLGADPWGFLGALMTKLDTGHCPVVQKDDYRSLLSFMLQAGFANRSLLPALAYRIDRCDATDQTVIQNLLSFAAANSGIQYFSGALHFNVVAGELAERPTPTQAQIAATEAPLFVTSLQLGAYGKAIELWPAYAHDAFFGAYATTTTPILMLQSPLDAQTAFAGASDFASHYTQAHQTFVVIDRGSHGLVNQSPTAMGDCGMNVIGQFIVDPTKTLDTSCNADVLPLDFEHKGESFGTGTKNVWDNGTMLTANGPPPKNLLLTIPIEAAKVFRGVR